MKITIKTLKGNIFSIDVQPADTVIAVKKRIEETQGKDAYPCVQQLLIHQGKVLKDDTTIEENKITENGFLVVMLTKTKSTGAGATSSAAGATSTQPSSATTQTDPTPSPAVPASPPRLQPAAVTPSTVASAATTAQENADNYGDAASNLVSGNNLEQTIQHILDMGGGSWDRETVIRALRAAFNNPERAVEYLYSGIPEAAEVPVPVARQPSSNPLPTGQVPTTAPSQAAPPSGGPNAAPLNLFPQGLPSMGAGAGAEGGALDFLRNNQQFQALRTMVQANPQILQPMLQELSKQNPQLMRLIQDHQADFLRLINEPVEGAEGNFTVYMGTFGQMIYCINCKASGNNCVLLFCLYVSEIYLVSLGVQYLIPLMSRQKRERLLKDWKQWVLSVPLL